jgi:hypothetical protein
VGGIFFDDFSELGMDQSFAMMQSVGDALLTAYMPIVMRRKDTPYGERERDFQLYRRGRYVEFNLVWDRGTHFGLAVGWPHRIHLAVHAARGALVVPAPGRSWLARGTLAQPLFGAQGLGLSLPAGTQTSPSRMCPAPGCFWWRV